MNAVVVTGIGAVSPLGNDAAALHEGWTAGRSGITQTDSGMGEAPCAAFDPELVMTRKEARRADRFTQLALLAAAEAMAQAGLASDVDPERTGCIVGTGIGGIETLTANHSKLEQSGPERVSPLSIPLMMSNAAPAAVAMKHDLRGPVFGVVSACAAGAHAIGAAARTIKCGDAEVVVCGGSEAALNPLARAAFGALEATSPTGVSRPFDARRDGFVMGEGAGILVLEDEEHARKRGATILARLTGYGATSDAHHLTAPHPEGRAAARAISLALEDAGRTPADVAYVNAHGTSTPLNDAAETAALKLALGAAAAGIPISSTKSAIGHLLGAAGAVEAVATITALRAGIAPPTLGWSERDEQCDLDYVPDSPRPLQGDRLVALSNSFGFGGHNAVLCLETP